MFIKVYNNQKPSLNFRKKENLFELTEFWPVENWRLKIENYNNNQIPKKSSEGH